LDLSKTICRKRGKIEDKLLLITNKKWYIDPLIDSRFKNKFIGMPACSADGCPFYEVLEVLDYFTYLWYDLFSRFCTAHRIECPIILQWAATFSSKMPIPFRLSGPHLTHGSYGPPELSSQTASLSVQSCLYGSQMLYCTMHCQRGRKTPILPLPIGISSPCRTMTKPRR